MSLIQKNTNLTSPRIVRAAFAFCFFMMYQEQATAFQARTPAVTDGWEMAEVTAESALIHQKPNDLAFITDNPRKGDLVWVRMLNDESEWFIVRPVDGSLSWILESDVSEVRAGEGRVKSSRTRIRPGRIGAKLPGPPGVELPQGATVWLMAREPLVLPQREGLLTWRAIEPPAGELRYVRKEQLRLVDQKKSDAPSPEGFIEADGPGRLVDHQPKKAAARREMPNTLSDDEVANKAENNKEIAQIAEEQESPAPARSPKPMIDSLAILDLPADGLDPGASQKAKPETDMKSKPAKIDSLDDQEELKSTPRSIENDLPSRSEVVSKPEPVELPAEIDQAIESLDSRFRLIISGPLVAWDFRPILAGCDQLSARPLTAKQAARVNALRLKAESQNEIGASSRQFWDSMRRSRSSDPGEKIGQIRRPPSQSKRFDITGLMLPSRRDIDGQLLYNLIGDSGTTTAYLKLPPASPVEKWLGKRVAVKGKVRYNEDLRARLVTVQDVELLDPEE